MLLAALAMLGVAASCVHHGPGAEPAAGPRYVCRIDHHSGLAGDCELESVVNPGPAAQGTMDMWEVTRYPGQQPTPAQQRAADDLVQACYGSAQRHGWYDFDQAVADGYAIKASGDPVHFTNKEYQLDDRVLDPDHPEVLMYYDTPQGKTLVGFMFLARTIDSEGPQIGGPLTPWHFHTWWGPLCFEHRIVDAGRPVDGNCPEGSEPSWRSPEMLHVWLLDHPLGRFSAKMYLEPSLLQQLLQHEGHH